MKCFKQLAALALFYFAAGAIAHEGHDDAPEGAAADVPSDVHALKTGNFKDFIAAHPLVLAECRQIPSFYPLHSQIFGKLQSFPGIELSEPLLIYDL